MEEETQKESKNWCKETITKTESAINEIVNSEINPDNIVYLGKLIDIHKDLENEKYWKEKINMYRDRDYYGNNSYGRRERDSRGRYMESSYGRQGVKGTGPYSRYRGEEMIDEMHDHYDNYSDMKSHYGTNEDTKKSLKYMLNSAEDFFCMLMQEANSPEEIELVKESARRISEM